MTLLCPRAFANSAIDESRLRAERDRKADAAVYTKPDVAGDPVVKISPSAAYQTKRVVLFPFEIPGLVLKGVMWPIGAGLDALNSSGAVTAIENALSNKDHTFYVYPILEGGAGSGFGGGPGVRHTNLFGKGYELNARYTIHVNLNQDASLVIGKDNERLLFGKPLGWKSDLAWSYLRDQDFYGIGNNSSLSNHGRYSLDEIKFNAIGKLNVGASVFPFVGAGFDAIASGFSDYGGVPSVTAIFPRSSLPGYTGWHTYFVFQTGIFRDTRDKRLNPSSGGRYLGSFKRYQALNGGGLDFNEYNLDFWHYFPLWRKGFVLSIHNGWQFKQALGSNSVPFFKLATLDADNMLSGFDRGRFNDISKYVFNARYKYPIWSMLEGIFLFDFGRVFHGIRHISVEDMKYSGGLGFNLALKDAYLMSFTAAYGGEGVKLTLGVKKDI